MLVAALTTARQMELSSSQSQYFQYTVAKSPKTLLLQVATLVAILKTARQMGLYQDLSHVMVPGEGSVAIPQGLLQRAVASSTESLQVDALQLACMHPRPTSLPGNTLRLPLPLRGGH